MPSDGLAVALLVEAHGGVATPVGADPMPPMYDFLRAWTGSDASPIRRWTTT